MSEWGWGFALGVASTIWALWGWILLEAWRQTVTDIYIGRFFKLLSAWAVCGVALVVGFVAVVR